MFEIEAEEYVIKKHNIDITKQSVDFSLRCEFAEDFTDFQKGAEFGYNKANEFHYCKDGLPEKEKSVLIYTEIKNVYMAKLVKDDYFITKEGGYVQTSAVIAWKEIELPKESEECTH